MHNPSTYLVVLGLLLFFAYIEWLRRRSGWEWRDALPWLGSVTKWAIEHLWHVFLR